MKKSILIALLIVIAISLSFIYLKNPKSNNNISPDILLLTQPVMSITGKVEKISGNQITVSKQVFINQPQVAPPVPPVPGENNQKSVSPPPAPQTSTITYTITISDKTKITQTQSFVPYLFKTSPNTPGVPTTPDSAPQKTIKDITEGVNITISTTQDLRTLSSNTFEASHINLPPISNRLSGQIVEVGTGVLTIKAVSSIAPPTAGATPPQEKQYSITLTSETEISRTTISPPPQPGNVPQPPKPERLSVSDLAVGSQVTVYTAEDTNTSKTLTALSVQSVSTPTSLPKTTTAPPSIPATEPRP